MKKWIFLSSFLATGLFQGPCPVHCSADSVLPQNKTKSAQLPRRRAAVSKNASNPGESARAGTETVQTSSQTSRAPSNYLTRSSRVLPNPSVLRPQHETNRFNEPFDLVELIPIVRDINRMIPRSFSLADHEIQLDPRYMVIQHHFLDIQARSTAKTSVITFTYFGAMGSRLSTRLDVPLFYSSVMGFSNWSRYPMGNYTMRINRDNPFSEEGSVYIRALTRF